MFATVASCLASTDAAGKRTWCNCRLPHTDKLTSVADIMKHRGIPDEFEQAILVENAADYPDLLINSKKTKHQKKKKNETREPVDKKLDDHTRIFIPGERDVGLVKMLIDWRDSITRQLSIMSGQIKQSKERAPEDNWAMVSVPRRLRCNSELAPLFVFEQCATSSSQMI